MLLPEPLNSVDLQPFLDNPAQLASQTSHLQLAIANYPATGRHLLEILTCSNDPQVAQAARLHVNWAGEITDFWQETLDAQLQNARLGHNDRLAVELLKFAPVPDCFFSEWVPAERFIEALRNPYLPLRFRLKLLKKLAKEPTIEPRLQVAESPETPLAVLEELAGDLEIPIRLAVKENSNCPPGLIELVEGQHTIATDWNTDASQLVMLGQSRWGWIRLTVAQNPAAPTETLMQLARDSAFKIQLAVAKNPQTPANVLAVLAEHPDRTIQEAVAIHPKAAEEILHQLFPTQQYILKNCQKNLPPSILERFFREAPATGKPIGKHELRYLLLRERHTPTWILSQLANVDLEEVRAEKLASRQDSPEPELLEKWILDELRFLAEIAKHPQVSGEILERLSQYPIPDVQLAVAQNSLTSEALRTALLQQLINSSTYILTKIASDPNTPVTILEQLAQSPSIANLAVEAIRQMLPNVSTLLLNTIRTFFSNRQPPRQILLGLRQDPVFREAILQEWRQLLADLNEVDRINIEAVCRQMLPAIGLSGGLPYQDRWLSKYRDSSAELYLYGFLLWFGIVKSNNNSPNRNVCLELVGNPNTPAATREKLKNQLARPSVPFDASQGDCDLFLALAYNPAIPEAERREYLRQLVTKGYERERIAKAPRTPADILEQLLAQGRKQEIAKNPALPESLLRRIAGENQGNTYLNNYLLRRIAENENAPVDLLIQFTKMPDEPPTNSNPSMLDLVLKNPNLPILERYRMLLEKEQEQENAIARKLMSRRPNSPYGLAEVVKSGDKPALYNVARHSLTPIPILEQLAKHPDETVRCVLLENRNLPLQIRRELTRDPSVSVRSRLAYKHHNLETPVQVLEILALDESERVRVSVAENPDTPVEVLVKLANDSSREVKIKIVNNLNTPVAVLERLGLEEGIFSIRNPNTPGNVLDRAVAGMGRDRLVDLAAAPQMPASTLVQLANSNNNSVRQRVAKHLNTPASALEKLSRDSITYIVSAVASNRNTPPQVLEKLAANPDRATRHNVAGNPNTPPAALEIVARYRESEANAPSTTKDAVKSTVRGDNSEILRTIAANPRTPVAVLEMLAARDFPGGEEIGREPNEFSGPITPEQILKSLVLNPSLTAQILTRLALDPNPKIRSLSINNPHTTPEIWEQLARDEDLEVRCAIASSSKCPTSILLSIASDAEEDVRQKVGANPNTPANALEFLSQDADAQVREAIASNPNTIPSVLELLAQDEKIEVRRAAAKNPQTPASIREFLRDLAIQPYTRQSSPTLRGLSRIYNPKTDDLPTLLSEYVQSPNHFVRFVALMHPLTPVDSIKPYSQSVFWSDRYAVADNPSTPVQMRQQLALDSNRIVRATAKSYLQNL